MVIVFTILKKNKASILREKRLVLGLTQQQVADLAKISCCQYQRFESGERNIMTASFQIACRIIKALNWILINSITVIII